VSKGTFGLGAITMYHFTDVISVVSGEDVLMLDIHRQWLPKNNSSMKGNFLKLQLLNKFPDQFSPFIKHSSIFPCNMTERFQGTLFRLPLRTKDTCKTSIVKTVPLYFDEVQKFFNTAIAVASEMLFFLQYVEQIEFYVCQVCM
jgi:sacsin